MAYFLDLSPYSYADATPRPEILNVGWLEPGYPFPTGTVSQELKAKLLDLAENHSVRVMRGMHRCGFCTDWASPFGGILVAGPNGEVALGNAEIRVMGEEGRWYAAPNMIYHYIERHGYLPPLEFLEALEKYSPLEGERFEGLR